MTLEQILDAKNPNTDSILHATRYFLAEKCGDVPPSQMRKTLLEAGIPEPELNSTIKRLEFDLASLEEGSLLILDAALQGGEDDHVAIERSFDEAATKLPVIETALVALVVMYGLYLFTPASDKPVRIVKRKIVKKDGTIETSSDASYHEPAGALAAVVSLVRGAKFRQNK
ncbi:MAG: hypothetical protein ACJ71W_17270 [Terriglobales bacterium]